MAAFEADRWQRVSPLLDRALELAGADRTAWLETLRRDQPATAAELALLLDEHQALVEERFLDTARRRIDLPRAGEPVGAYTIVSLLGEGGMGSVWLAERSDGRFARRAAVKFPRLTLTGAAEARFRREVALLGRLAHPNIAQLVDAGVSDGGQPYLLLEYVDGVPIDTYCADRSVDEPDRVRLVVDVLAALAHAHANLIVHRDLKPSNVLVTADGHVKLLDFGIAKLLESDGAAAPTLLTHDAGAALTPAYAAPEQLTTGAVTTATDVYAAGVLLYQLVTGRHPAGDAARSPAALMHAILEGEPDRRLAGDLDIVVRKALKKAPAERYASATAFADDLRRCLRHEPIAARRDSAAYRARKFLRRNRAASILGAVALAGTAAGVAGTVIQARTARTQRDFAVRELARAQATNDLNAFLLSDAAPLGKPFTVDDLLARAEHIVERQDAPAATQTELLMSIGRQYTTMDRYGKARRLLEQAYALAQTQADPVVRARAACSLAQTLGNVGEIPRAEALIAEGLRGLPADPTFAEDRVNCLLRGSEVANRRGAIADELARAQSALALSTKLPARSELLELDATIDLAGAYTHAGRYHDAAATFAQASRRLTALGRDDTERAATLFNNWALALSLAGRPLEAEPIFRRAMGIDRDAGGEARVAPTLLANYARVLQDLGQDDRAADYAARAYAKARAADAQVTVSQVRLLQASIARGQGDIAGAERLLAEAEPWIHTALRPGHIAYAAFASQHALIEEAKGDRATALARADESIAIVDASIARHGEGLNVLPTYLTRRSAIELSMDRVDAAAADARRALELASAAGSPSMIDGRAAIALGLALRQLGRSADARAAFRTAADQLLRAGGADHPETRRAQQLARE